MKKYKIEITHYPDVSWIVLSKGLLLSVIKYTNKSHKELATNDFKELVMNDNTYGYSTMVDLFNYYQNKRQ